MLARHGLSIFTADAWAGLAHWALAGLLPGAYTRRHIEPLCELGDLILHGWWVLGTSTLDETSGPGFLPVDFPLMLEWVWEQTCPAAAMSGGLCWLMAWCQQ
jgi:hypothetical protein